MARAVLITQPRGQLRGPRHPQARCAHVGAHRGAGGATRWRAATLAAGMQRSCARPPLFAGGARAPRPPPSAATRVAWPSAFGPDGEAAAPHPGPARRTSSMRATGRAALHGGECAPQAGRAGARPASRNLTSASRLAGRRPVGGSKGRSLGAARVRTRGDQPRAGRRMRSRRGGSGAPRRMAADAAAGASQRELPAADARRHHERIPPSSNMSCPVSSIT
jgi:hypothetical protein